MSTDRFAAYAKELGKSDWTHGFGLMPDWKLRKLFPAPEERASYRSGYEAACDAAPHPGREPTYFRA